jgi:hypothetical protein
MYRTHGAAHGHWPSFRRPRKRQIYLELPFSLEACAKRQIVGRRCWVAQEGTSPGCLFEAPKPTPRATCKGYHNRRAKDLTQSNLLWNSVVAVQYSRPFVHLMVRSKLQRCTPYRPFNELVKGPFPGHNKWSRSLSRLHWCIHYEDARCKDCGNCCLHSHGYRKYMINNDIEDIRIAATDRLGLPNRDSWTTWG